ncbi:hypothetical protein [Fulvivirga lutea]|uniref:Uncharacterized protein n=1 Tax=Fulvivirga lutea TaxID=2810512 RepID=A0A974WHB9_9BACT|nr:hypothetical protein [Fulvivirga lutea]QSE98115.1 hypothetical protein JR347_03265 [Fulvivirga lutea]
MRKLILGIILIVGCKEIAPRETSAYFSLDSLLNKQSELLQNEDVTLRKRAIVGNDTASNEIKLDSLGWANEFEFMRDLDINKPALIGRYNRKVVDDINSNLKVIDYSANEDNLRIRKFRIYYLDKPENIRIISAMSKESNSIFKSSKKIKLEFDEFDGQTVLTSYSLRGYQKMILQDSIVFKVDARLMH